MDAVLYQLVWQRAGDCCEYCHLPQSAIDITFHVEHIIAQQHLGETIAENLALACERCNLYKGPNLSAIDPLTKELVPLFHPRRDRWSAHFDQCGDLIAGLSPVGRATVRLLNMNSPARRKLRNELQERGEL